MITAIPNAKNRLTPLRKPISLLLAPSGSAGWAACSLMPIELAQCRFEIGDQLPIGSLAGSAAGDDHIIGSRPALVRQHFSRGRPQPPLGPVAGDGVAHPAARGEADPHRRSAICFD